MPHPFPAVGNRGNHGLEQRPLPERSGQYQPSVPGGVVYRSHVMPHAADVDPAPADPDGESSDFTESFRRVIDAMSMPKTSLMKFDGNPLKFWVFLQSFDTCVGKTLVDDGVKLNQLMESCVGKAATVIQPCALMEASAGYRRARQLLQQRFGNDFRISEAYVAKVTEGPTIRGNDGDVLQEFADDLGGCVETLRAMGRMEEIDTRSRMLKIVERLPTYIQGRWRRIAIDDMETKGRYPGIEQFAEFVQRAAREATDPVFGMASSKMTTREKANVPMKKFSSFTVQTREGRGPDEKKEHHKASQVKERQSTQSTSSDRRDARCYVCQGAHFLVQCDNFKRKSAEERLKIVKELRLCFCCLSSRAHGVRLCRKPGKCGKGGCERRHSSLLHDALVQLPRVHQSQNGVSADKEHGTYAKSYACGTGGPEIALPIVQVDVRGEGKQESVRTLALLDPGSNRSFCSMSLLKTLGLHGDRTSLEMETLHDNKRTEAVEIALEVSGVTGRKKCRRLLMMKRVYALEKFPDLDGCVGADVTQWEHLRDLDVPRKDGTHVCLLIGQDVPGALMPLEVKKGGVVGEPYAVRTALGWIVNGVLSDEASCRGMASSYCAVAPSRQEDALDKQVQQFWNLDTGQYLAGGVPQMSIEDRAVVQRWSESIKLEDEHYVLEIPFKGEKPLLPDNRVVAERRLMSLGRRLSRDEELLQRYRAEIDKLIEKGFAEKVEEDDAGPSGGTWYLPHHCVLNENKPGKCRVVFDCAAEFDGTSLNKSVHQGPDMTNKLIGILLRFREGQVGMMADVEAMYHQVRVPVEQRDVLRFLWFKNGDVQQKPEAFRMTVHLFGGVWSPACANFAVKRAADDQRQGFDEKVCQIVKKNFYVDDCLPSVDDVHEAIQLANGTRELMKNRGFRLTKWLSNSKEVIEAIPVEDRAKNVQNLDLGQSSLPTDRALGVTWAVEDDRLGVRVGVKPQKPTRRGILKVFSSVFDLLGIMCPVVLKAKILFQAECM